MLTWHILRSIAQNYNFSPSLSGVCHVWDRDRRVRQDDSQLRRGYFGRRAERVLRGSFLPHGHMLNLRGSGIDEYSYGDQGLLCTTSSTEDKVLSQERLGHASGSILDIKVVGSHHLAPRRWDPGPGRIKVEVLVLSDADLQAGKGSDMPNAGQHCRLFSQKWGQIRFENLEEGIISSDGCVVLIQFKLRYRKGGEGSKRTRH